MIIKTITEYWLTKYLFSHPWILYLISLSTAFIIVVIDDINILQFKDIYSPIRLVLIFFITYLIVFIHRPWRYIRSPINGIPGSDIRWLFTVLTSILIVFFIAIISIYLTRLHSLLSLGTDMCCLQKWDYVINFRLGFLPQGNGSDIFLLGSTDALVASLVGVATITALIIQYAQDIATLNRFGDAAGFFKTLEEALERLKEGKHSKLFSTRHILPEDNWDMMYMGVTPFPLHMSEGEESDKFINIIKEFIGNGTLKKVTYVVRDNSENEIKIDKYIENWEKQIVKSKKLSKKTDPYQLETPLKYYFETINYIAKKVDSSFEYFKGQFKKGCEDLKDINEALSKFDDTTLRFCAIRPVTESYVFVFRKEAIFGFMEHYPILPNADDRISSRPLSILGYSTNDMNIVKVLRDRINRYFSHD